MRRPCQLRKAAGRGVGRVWVRDEDSGDVAAVGGGAGRDAGQLLGGRRAAETPSTVAGAHHVSDLRGLAVNDGDDDGQRRVWLPATPS